MPQVKKWSNAELNRRLTELQGYNVKPASDIPKWYRMVNPQGQEFGIAMPTEGLVWNEYAFPYCTDPAASLEVQAKAIKVNKLAYLNALLSIVSPEEVIQYGPDGIMEVVGYTIDGTAAMFTCTHRQRAEAAYMTLSQGRDNI